MNHVATLALMSIYWPVWLVWGIAFLAAELTALRLRHKYPDVNNNGGTLSELVWWLVRGRAWYHHTLYVLLLGFFIDLGSHFFLGTKLF